jgi:hypothetical protein
VYLFAPGPRYGLPKANDVVELPVFVTHTLGTTATTLAPSKLDPPIDEITMLAPTFLSMIDVVGDKFSTALKVGSAAFAITGMSRLIITINEFFISMLLAYCCAAGKDTAEFTVIVAAVGLKTDPSSEEQSALTLNPSENEPEVSEPDCGP